jgi:putative hydrolase of the HAD superfamily
MILVFDLDDTLYEELTFVRSGFWTVAYHLEANYNIPAEHCYQQMIKKLEEGRGQVFDDVLKKYAVYSKQAVSRCLSVYRGHKPSIQLDTEAEACLQRFKDYPVYIVTDGNKLVQKRKLEALGLYSRIKFCFRTYQFGVKHSKPSPHCFLNICKREKVSPNKVAYVGDNPNKDFVGIKPLGFKTIRIVKGPYATLTKPSEFEADYRIHSLDELTEGFLNCVIQSDREVII